MKMLRSSGITLSLWLGLSVIANAQSPAEADATPQPFAIEKSDPSLDNLIAPDAKLTTVAGGFGFIDTPLWIRGRDGQPGYLVAVSIIDNVIYKG